MRGKRVISIIRISNLVLAHIAMQFVLSRVAVAVLVQGEAKRI